MDHTVQPANNTMPAFSLRSKGAATDCGDKHLVAYYSLIDLDRMKG